VALKKCKECGHSISSKAKACPNCGAPIKKGSNIKIGCLGAVIIFLAIGFIAGSISNHFSKKKKEGARIEKQAAVAKLEMKEKNEFIKNIEEHYKKLGADFESSNLNINNEISLFIKYGRLDYKDVAEYKRKLDIRGLEGKVSVIPASKVSENLNIYKRLSALDPENQKYKKKVGYYAKKIARQQREEERRRKIYAACIAKYGAPPINSAWDGSVVCVKRYLKTIAKDPDSLKFEGWGKVTYDPNMGWLVWCKYRGKNSFGGYIRNANWFVIRHNHVVVMKDIAAYRY
jgi:zinc-ribbon domain